MMKKIIPAILICALGGVVVLGLSGCFGKKYRVDYCGSKDCYTGAKDSYRAGAEVVLYYEMIATDTDYSFFLDGERLQPLYEEGKGYKISFVMPEHDVTLKCESHNSMVYEPEETMMVDYYTAVVATAGGDRHDEMVLSDIGRTDRAKLDVYSADADSGETCVSYLVPYEAVDRCYEVINEGKFAEWNIKFSDTALDGGVTAVKFRNDDGSYTRVSTDAMPDDGLRQMGEIAAIIRGYIRDENLM